MILKNKKVVLNIANIVTANQCANITLSAGASPVMSRSLNDSLDLLKFSSALVINIGTINEDDVKNILEIQSKANELKIPVILDPVGSGATSLRTSTAKKIVKNGVTLIKGNYSEVLSLVKFINTSGVDSSIDSLSEEELKNVQKELDAVVVITGKSDYLITKNDIKIYSGGHKNMSLITGMGCMLASLIGSLATENNIEVAASRGISIFNEMTNMFEKTLPSYNDIYNKLLNYE